VIVVGIDGGRLPAVRPSGIEGVRVIGCGDQPANAKAPTIIRAITRPVTALIAIVCDRISFSWASAKAW